MTCIIMDVLCENPEPSHTSGHLGQQYRHMHSSQAAEGNAAEGNAAQGTVSI